MSKSLQTPAVDSSQLSAGLKSEAARLGFELCGIVPAVSPNGLHDFQNWLARGYAGEMHYLPRREAAYEHPRAVLASVRSIVMLALNYKTSEPLPTKPGEGRVSRYAWGELDYHDLIREKLRRLADFLHQQQPGCQTRGVVDTAPILERDFARIAGLGWFGKNTMLINKQAGSWLFLAGLLVDVDLEYDTPHETSHCGTCTRCLDACPTDAFPAPYVLDARKCISYLTIELREQIPSELRNGMGEWLFGCDICQDVCPWNTKAPQTGEPVFQPASDLSPANAIEWLGLNEEQFRKRFRHTPLWRSKRAGLLRNAAVVLGNSDDRRAVPALTISLADNEPLVRGASAWALGRLGGEKEVELLRERLNIEMNVEVSQELTAAIDEIESSG